MSRTRTLITLLLTLLLSVSLVACSGDKPAKDESPDSGSSATPEAPPEPQTEPLTGIELPAGESVERKHAVIVVKIDNVEDAAPQSGLSQADLVVEEEVEGGATRLAAFYYSTLPKVVGPVRSMRASDIGIVSPVGASIVTSGAAAVTIGRIRRADIRFFEEGSDGIYRDNERFAPHNVFTDLTTIAKHAKSNDGRPSDYLPWGAETDFVGVQPATKITADFGYIRATEWEFRDGTYVNTNSYAAADDQFPADTVLVLRVKVGDAGYTDPAGNPVPETKFVGKGKAMIFHAGQVMRASWSKSDLGAPLELSTAAGPVRIPAGKVFIELVPAKTGSVTFN